MLDHLRLTIIVACALLGACSRTDDLTRFIEDTKHQPGGRAEPLPEIKPYESFVYNAYDLRSPFLPSSRGSGAGLGVRPDQKRNREFLERYSPELAKPIPLAIPALTDGKIFL